MKYLIILFCFFTVSAQAQRYTFNTMINYRITFGTYNGDDVTYTDTNHPGYFLSLHKYEDSFIARLIDYNNLVNHTFNVVEDRSGGSIQFSFHYVSSTDMKHLQNSHYHKYIFDFKTIEEKDGIKTARIDIYRTKKRRKLVSYYEIELEKSTENYFPAFRVSFTHPFETASKMDPYGNYKVVRAKGKSWGGKEGSCVLQELRPVSFELNVPVK